MTDITQLPRNPAESLPITKPSDVERRLEKEDLHRLWCLYLGWRTAVSGNGRRSFSTVETNAITEIESAVKNLIAPHWPSIPEVSFLVALMCSTADTANRFSSADSREDESYVELAFEMFWSGLQKLTQEQDCLHH